MKPEHPAHRGPAWGTVAGYGALALLLALLVVWSAWVPDGIG